MRTLLLATLIALPLLTCACAGSVSTDGDVDSFGPGTSSAYVQLDLDGDRFHFFLLSNKGGLCGKLESAYERAILAIDDFDDVTDDDECDDYVAALAEAWDPVVSGGANFAYAIRWDDDPLAFLEGFDELTEPREGTHDVDDGEATLDLAYFPSDSPYQTAAERQAGCDLDDVLDDADDSVVSLIADNGTLELEESDSGAWRVEFEADMDDEGGGSAGSISGGFGASECVIDANAIGAGALLNRWGLLPWALR